MKIILVNKYWHPKGGAEKVAMDTYHLLKQAGHDVRVFGMKSEGDVVDNPDGISYIEYNRVTQLKRIFSGIRAIYNADAVRRFGSLIERWKPDVLHFHNISYQLSYGLLGVIKKRGVPAVMTLHDYSLISPNYLMFHHGRIDTSSAAPRYYRCLLNNCMEGFGKSAIATVEAYVRKWKRWTDAIDAYIAPTRFLFNEHLKVGMLKEKFYHIPYPVPFGSSPSNSGISERRNVVYVGRLVKEKGVDILLRAAKRLGEIRFEIVGEGVYRPELELIVKKLQLSNVFFLGYQTSERVKQIMQHARLVVIPSIWYETPSLVSIEAVANGVLPLGSNIGAIPEVLPAELIFPPGDPDALAKQIHFWYNRSEAVYAHTAGTLFHRLKQIHDPAKYLHAIESLYGAVV